MSAILNLLYREYCRARLAEMRKQLLLSANDEIPAASWDASDSAGPNDRGSSFSDDIATKKPQPSGNDNGSVSAPARYLRTSGA
jgi:hypothetical protein